jgi:geranylgeranyl pyrophosphate synthase
LIACERDRSIAKRLEHDRELAWVLEALESTGALEAALDRARVESEAARTTIANLEESEWRSTLEKVLEGVLAQVPVGVA